MSDAAGAAIKTRVVVVFDLAHPHWRGDGCDEDMPRDPCEYVGARGPCQSKLARPVPIWRDGAYVRVAYYCPRHRDSVVRP